MVFSSHLFVYYFLPLALVAYYLAPRRARNLTLTAASYVFYGWWNPIFVTLLVVSTLIDYVAGLALVGGWRQAEPLPLLPRGQRRTAGQRAALVVSIVTNLLILAFFKYFNFATDSYNVLVDWLGLPQMRLDSVMRVVLPLGISFYTFQSMSYTIDVYRGDARAMKNVVAFFTFESMFPQLVAGPIIRYTDIDEQLRARDHTWARFARGVSFFALGMAKKVLLANPCGKIADTAFDAGSLVPLDAWWGVVAYAFQIYFDFSGYSDMAIGLGLMVGFVFPKNFDSPYKADSLTDFWRRWHISLSTCLRDYLYVPLGGNRKGRARTYVNLMLVMLLGGLWHGASWNFVIWGGLHGAGLALERADRRTGYFARLPRAVRVATTFLFVLVGWVFFRAPDLRSALDYLGAMFGGGSPQAGAGLLAGLLYRPYYALCVGLAAAIAFFAPQTWDWTRRLTWTRAAACLAALWLALVAMATQGYNPFIYFIF